MTATITSSKTMWKHAGTLTDKLFFLVFEVEKTVCRLMGEGWGVSRKRVGLGGAIRPLSLGSHILKSSVEQSGGCHRVFFLMMTESVSSFREKLWTNERKSHKGHTTVTSYHFKLGASSMGRHPWDYDCLCLRFGSLYAEKKTFLIQV